MATCSSILAWKIPWQRSLADYNPWSHKELDTTESMCTRTHVRTRTHVCEHTHANTLTYTRMHTHVHTRANTCTHAHPHIHACTHIRTRAHMRVHTRTHAHRCTHAHACTHTHTHIPLLFSSANGEAKKCWQGRRGGRSKHCFSLVPCMALLSCVPIKRVFLPWFSVWVLYLFPHSLHLFWPWITPVLTCPGIVHFSYALPVHVC